MLELTLRQRVQALPNTLFSPAFVVVGLQTNPNHTRITGIHVRQHNQTQQQSMLTADLIIDASGQFSKITQWLHDLNYEVPEPERLKAAVGYSTRYYKFSPRFDQERVSNIIHGDPEKQIRFAFGFQMENNQMQVVLYGAGGHYPATDDDGFEQQLRQVTSPELADMLQADTEPISSPKGYHVPASGLLVLGDALCNFDPIYGHGMTITVFEA